MGVDMKLKAKPKLTPERLKKRMNKVKESERSLKFKTVNVEIHGVPNYFDGYEISSFVKMVNCALLPKKKSKAKLEFHCDADFY